MQWAPISRRVLQALPRVRCVVRYGVGVNNIDLDAAADLGVMVVNVPDYCLEEVSNHAVAMILSLAKQDGSAVIDLIDTGTGIPAEAAAKIFDAYYSTKKGGTGLGLAMAKRIVKEHGGDISVRSEPGKGTDFTLRLPV